MLALLAVGLLSGLASLGLVVLILVCWSRSVRRDPPGPDPIDGRFCGRPGCGGLLAYKRARLRLGDQVVFRTYLVCWSCGSRLALHDEPEYSTREEGTGS